MKRVLVLATAFALAACTASSPQTRVGELAERYAAGVERVVAAFDDIRDEASAIAAADAFVAWSEELATSYAAQVKALSDDEKIALSAREAELSGVMRNLALEGLKKVSAYPNAARYLGQRAQAMNRRIAWRLRG